jgi:hypothetical protein
MLNNLARCLPLISYNNVIKNVGAQDACAPIIGSWTLTKNYQLFVLQLALLLHDLA